MKLSRRKFLKKIGQATAGLSLLPFVELEAVGLTLKENPTLVDIKSDTHISSYAKIGVGDTEYYMALSEIKGSPTLYRDETAEVFTYEGLDEIINTSKK